MNRTRRMAIRNRLLLTTLAGFALLHPQFGHGFSLERTATSTKSAVTKTQGTLTPTIQSWMKDGQVMLRWEGATPRSANVINKQLTIRFGRKIMPRFGNILRNVYPHVTQVALTEGGKTVVLTLRGNYAPTLSNMGGATSVALNTRQPTLPALSAKAANQLAPAAATPSAKKRALDPLLPPLREAGRNNRPVVPPLPDRTPQAAASAKVKKPVRKAPAQLVETVPAPKPAPQKAKHTQTPVAKPELATSRFIPKPRPVLPTKKVAMLPQPEKRPEKKRKVATAPHPKNVEKKVEQQLAAQTLKQAAVETGKPVTVGSKVLPEKAPGLKVAAPAVPIPEASGVKVAAKPTVKAASEPSPPLEKEQRTEIPSTGEAVTLYVKDTSEGPQLRVPWTERTAAAVYERSGMLWMVFDKKAKLDVGKLPASSPFSNPEVSYQEDYTILRLTTAGDDAEIYVTRDKFEWVVQLRNDGRKLTRPLPLTVSTAPPLKPHLFAPILQTAKPLKLEDPLIGDIVHVVPFFKPSIGITQQRQFIEFVIPKTYQGLIMQPLADGTRIALTRNGFRITSREALQFSEDLPKLDIEMPDYETATLFPYDQWQPPMVPVEPEKPDEKKDIGEKDEEPEMRQLTFEEYRQQLLKKIVNNTGERALKYRLKLAQLYLGEGLAAEANGMLRRIAEESPEFYTSRRLGVLTAASNFLMYRILEAAQMLHEPSLDQSEEVAIWRAILGTMLGSSDSGYDFADAREKFIRHYPPKLKERLSILAADYYISQGKYNLALAVFKSMSEDNVVLTAQPYIDFLMAKISADTGDTARAKEKWQAMSEDVENRFIRARAAFSLTAMELAQGKISTKEAIEQFEKLRIVWRGDALEMNLLKALGELYYAEGNNLEALRAWREVTANFPDTQVATELVQKMSAIFYSLFNEGGADHMEPVAALAMYYEFRELTPVGREGDRMIRNLARRLVQVDLLDRAAALLLHQIRFRTVEEERSLLGVELAQIRLHNNEPALALEALNATDFEGNSESTRLLRGQTMAKGHIALKAYDKALAVLEGDDTATAMALRSQVYQEQGEWDKLVVEAEGMLNLKPNLTDPMTNDEALTAIRLALGYIQTDDYSRMELLERGFGPLFEKPRLKEAFAYITDHSRSITHNNVGQIAQVIAATEAFIARKAGESPFPPVETVAMDESAEPTTLSEAGTEEVAEAEEATP